MACDVDPKDPLVNEMFDETATERSVDDRDPQSPDDRDDHDRWLRENVPPHHG